MLRLRILRRRLALAVDGAYWSLMIRWQNVRLGYWTRRYARAAERYRRKFGTEPPRC